jgi:hypothetical protein
MEMNFSQMAMAYTVGLRKFKEIPVDFAFLSSVTILVSNA